MAILLHCYFYDDDFCSDKFEDYKCLKELADCVEPDPRKAEWIHACITRVSFCTH